MPDRAPDARSRTQSRRALLVAGLAGLVLSGCGQKGPLYFPEERIEEKKSKAKRSSLGRRGPTTA